MLDIGWSEMAVIALIALVVIGPKDLPQAMRTAAKWVRKARGLAREFQSGIDDMIREAELDDARKAIEQTRSFNVDEALEETVDPTGSVRDEVRDLETSARGEPASGNIRKTSDAAKTEAEATSNGGETAKVVEQPLKVAPAHSIKPPADPAAASGAESKSNTTQDEAVSKTGERKA